jgi:hypothetical protein
MSFKTKPMLLALIAELGASCLLVAGIILGIRQNAISVVSAQPLAAASSTALQPSATPFLPSPVTITVSASQPPALEIATMLPTETQSFSLPPLPTAAPRTTPIPTGLPLVTKGPLTTAQQLWLNTVSLRYLAPTTADGIRLAQALNYIGKDGHPSNICGPLSIAILRDAGIINPDTPLDKFWLLDPKDRIARQLLARTFPSEHFDDLKTTIPLNKFDWKASPLRPGDFLYIYAGPGGNFEHMLVVNRVDSQKRAYAVTNYATPNGFVILEVLLYDPNDQEIGIFHRWTKENNAMLGSTGFGGFEVWRLRSP